LVGISDNHNRNTNLQVKLMVRKIVRLERVKGFWRI
jgi:hypothetical protein